MKRLLTIGIGAGLAAGPAACHRADAGPEPGLTTTWHWVATTGGITGRQTTTPASTGTTLTWQFRPDSTVVVTTTRRAGPPAVDTVRYSLGTIRSIYSGQPARGLTLHRAMPVRYVVQELGPRLVLADNHYDGFTTTFEQ